MSRRLSLPLSLGLAVACVLLSGEARAADGAYSRAYTQCMASGDAAQGQTAGIIDCVNDEYGRRDTLLNQAYGAAMARLTPARKTALKLDERAWLKANVAACAHDQMQDGELGQIELHRCYLDRTILRTEWLRHFR